MLAIEWSDSNYMNVDEDKSHYLLSGYKYETVCRYWTD